MFSDFIFCTENCDCSNIALLLYSNVIQGVRISEKSGNIMEFDFHHGNHGQVRTVNISLRYQGIFNEYSFNFESPFFVVLE